MLDLFLKRIKAGEFTKAYQVALMQRARRKAQRMRSSETLPRRSGRELIARPARTVAMSNPA